MLRALLLGDHSETATHSVEQMSRVLSDLYDGMFQVETQTQYGALTAKTLTNSIWSSIMPQSGQRTERDRRRGRLLPM